MGLFKRLHRITIGRIESFLDKVEDPEILFPRLVKEMEQQLQEATRQEATAIASVKRAELDVAQAAKRVEELGNGAQRAMEVGDEETARQAIEAQIETEKNLALCQQNFETLDSTLNLATAARKQIQEQLEELKTRKREILTRATVAKTRKKIQRTVNGSIGSTDSILDAVARLEANVQETEAELEIQARLTGDARINPSLEKKLAELTSNAEVENRLKELKKKVAPSSSKK